MSSPLGRASELATRAIRSIILSDGTIQQRLYEGYTSLSGIREAELSEDAQVKLEELIAACTNAQNLEPNQDHVQASIYNMTNEEAQENAALLFALFLDIEEAYIKSV